MAPPGRPNATSTPSISRLLMRACAPVSFMRAPASGWAGKSGNEKAPRFGRPRSARDRLSVRLGNYENGGEKAHQAEKLTASEPAVKMHAPVCRLTAGSLRDHSVIAPLSAPVTNLAYLASTPLV